VIILIFQYAFLIAIAFYLLGLSFYLFHRSKTSVVLSLIGFIFHSLFQLSRGLALGVWLPNPIFDSSYFLPWSMTAISLGMRCFSKDKKDKTIINSLIIPVCLFSLLALIFPRGIANAPGPKHVTFYVSLYYGIDIIAQACFILGAWFAIFHLRGKDQERRFNYFMIAGFIFYSISQVIGAYWAYLGWALPMHWSTKHLQSASIWCYYAAILHLRYFPTWNSKQEAWFAVGGAILLLIFIYGTQISALSFPGIGG
jgi:hypothetical protein